MDQRGRASERASVTDRVLDEDGDEAVAVVPLDNLPRDGDRAVAGKLDRVGCQVGHNLLDSERVADQLVWRHRRQPRISDHGRKRVLDLGAALSGAEKQPHADILHQGGDVYRAESRGWHGSGGLCDVLGSV